MVVIQHDIIPDGDLELVLKDHSTKRVIPSVWFRYNIKEGMSHSEPDEDKVDLPQMSSPILWPVIFDTDDDPIEIRMRVSSRHLALASPIFKEMARGSWKEAHPAGLRTQHGRRKHKHPKVLTPLVRQVVTGWNAHALVAVLNVIHGHNSDVPREISLEFFANIAVIVDHYDCEKALQLAAELWYQSSYKAPTRYGKKTIMWFYIAWVFSWPKLFSEMGQIIWEHGMGLEMLKTKDLPVGQLLAFLDSKRQTSIMKILTELDTIACDLMHGRNGCHSRCNYMMIGLLTTEHCKMKNLDSPLDFGTKPFTGHSIHHLIKRLESFPAADLCDIEPDWDIHTIHKCSAALRLRPAIDEILGCIEKLSITEFQEEGF